MTARFPSCAALAIVGALLISTQLNAAVYYVSPTGSDTAVGSALAPFQTIQKGVDQATSGDLVLVSPGVYTNPPVATAASAGKSRLAITKNVTVRSTQGPRLR